MQLIAIFYVIVQVGVFFAIGYALLPKTIKTGHGSMTSVATISGISAYCLVGMILLVSFTTNELKQYFSLEKDIATALLLIGCILAVLITRHTNRFLLPLMYRLNAMGNYLSLASLAIIAISAAYMLIYMGTYEYTHPGA